jgi:hypothetical protein
LNILVSIPENVMNRRVQKPMIVFASVVVTLMTVAGCRNGDSDSTAAPSAMATTAPEAPPADAPPADAPPADAPPADAPPADAGTASAVQPMTPSVAQPTVDQAPPAARDDRVAIAATAKDELFSKISGRLSEVLQTQGAAAAIDVCSQEAGKISAAVGQAHGVEIGRTSFKLRNQENVPRDWVKPFVERRIDSVQHVALENGKLGSLFPIHIDVKCLMCHGVEDEILDGVKPALAERYPNDGATGFKQGELRGWFWVEVPAAESESEPEPPEAPVAES